MTKARKLCPECGKPMTWDTILKLWDCGPADEGGHGFWDDENVHEVEQSEPEPLFDLVDWCIRYDEGLLSEDEIDFGMQRLIDSGMAWKLQGRIGRHAMALIEDGRCHPAGRHS